MKYISILFVVMFMLATAVGAQTTVTGRVINDSTGEPLEGVNIVIIGTDMGAATDQNGEFTVANVPEGNTRIRASHIGFGVVTKRIQMEGPRMTVDFSLAPESLTAPQLIIEPTRAIERQTPVTFTNISEEDLNYRDQIQDIPLLLSDLPSTKTYSETGTGIGYSYLNIRGFDQRRISVLINGVPQNDPEDHNVYWIDFYDLVGSLKDIQVQRGAGTSFYGPASIGGSVNLVTQNYSRQPTLKAETMFGSYDTRKFSVEGSTGILGNHWIGYGRLTSITTDNYRDWSWMEFWRYFAGVGYFGTNHIVKVQTYGGPQEDGLAFYGIPKDYIDHRENRTINYSSATSDQEWFNQPHYEILHQWQLGENLTMNNTLYYIRGYGYFDYDGSWAPPSYYRLPVDQLTPDGWSDEDGTVSVASNTMIRAYVDNNQAGLLHKYTWDHADGTLTAGIAIRGHRSLHWGRIQESEGLVFTDTTSAMTSTVDLGEEYVGEQGNRYYRYNGGKSIYSIFGHESLALSSRTTMLIDLQLTRKQYEFGNEKYLGHEFDIPYFFVNPGIGLNVNFTDRVNVYVRVSKTTREPRLKNYYDAAEASQPAAWGAVVPQFEVNPDESYDYNNPLVKPETLYDLELGAGYRTTDLQLNANLYYMDFRNEIVKNGQLDRFGQPVTGNAERTRHYGVELSGTWRLLPEFQVSGNASFSANKFVKYTSFGWEDSQTLDGNTIAGFPAKLGNIRAQYTPGRLIFTMDGKFMGDQYTTNFEEDGPVVDAYNVWNAQIGYRLPIYGTTMRITVSVNNIFDTLYASHGEGEDFFPGAPRNYSLALYYEI